jgi:hypothetical protein
MSRKRINTKEITVTLETLLATLEFLQGLDLRKEGNFSQEKLNQMAVAEIILEVLTDMHNDVITKSEGSTPVAYTTITVPRQLLDNLQTFFNAHLKSLSKKK